MDPRTITPSARRQVTMAALLLSACATQADPAGIYGSRSQASDGGGAASGGSGASAPRTTGGTKATDGTSSGGSRTTGGTGGVVAGGGTDGTATGGSGDSTNGGTSAAGAGGTIGTGGNSMGGSAGMSGGSAEGGQGGSGGAGSFCDAQVSGGKDHCVCVVGPTHDYIFCDRAKNSGAANANCESAPGGFTVVAINDEDEDTWVFEQAQQYLPADTMFWTDGRRSSDEWSWEDGTLFWPGGYANWKDGTAPAEGSCVTVDTNDGAWTAVDKCWSHDLPYVCENG